MSPSTTVRAGVVEVSWLAVVVGAVGYRVLGALWYGPPFGSRWMAAGPLVAAVALAVTVDWAGGTTWLAGLQVGLVAGLGIVATVGRQAVPFEERPWAVYLPSTGGNLVTLAGVGVLLAAW